MTDPSSRNAVAFQHAWEQLLGVEQGYFDDPIGGPTMYGVTSRLARAHGYVGDIREIPISVARRIAKREFWDAMHLDSVLWQSEAIARELLEQGYHLGPVFPIKALQRALNAFGDTVTPLIVDGAIGTVTITALMAFLRKRQQTGESVLLRALNSMQCVGYIERAESDPRKRAFLFGWISKRVRIDP